MSLNNPYAAYQKQSMIMKNIAGATVRPIILPVNLEVLPAVATQNTQIDDKPETVNEPYMVSDKIQVSKVNNPYLANSVMTASPHELTSMLFQGAIKFMNQAIIYIKANKISEANHVNQRAQDIFEELMVTLDMKQDISHQLFSLYQFILDSLIEANINKNPDQIRTLIEMTMDLKATWQEAMKLAKMSKAT